MGTSGADREAHCTRRERKVESNLTEGKEIGTSSFVGHGLTALALLEAARRPPDSPFVDRRWTWLAFGLASLPDLDSVALALGGPAVSRFLAIANGYDGHRGLTHTALFALAAGAFVALLVRGAGWTREWRRPAMLLSLVVLSHPVLDSLMACGAGMPFFWPLSDARFLFPFPLTPMANYATTPGRLVGLLLEPGTWVAVVLEAGLFGPLYFATRFWRTGRLGRHAVPVRWRAVAWGECVLTALLFEAMWQWARWS